MSLVAQAPPGWAEVWNREIHVLIVRVFRARLLVIPLIALILCVFAVLDPVPWKLIWIGVTAAAACAISVIELVRIHRQPVSPRTIHVNLIAMLLLQTSMIYITGGIESPLIVIYVPIGVAAGLSLGFSKRAIAVAAVPVLFSIIFAAGTLGHWLPRATPGFFGLGQGFSDKPVYAWTKAGVISFLSIMTTLIGASVRTAYERIIHEMLGARKEALESLASRNREILSVASTVAHELKNPLTSIQGLAQLLARNAPASSKESERLEVMRREISRMVTVLDEFRNFTRPLSGLSIRSTNLSQLVEELLLLNEAAAERKGVQLSASTADPIIIDCDPHKIKQALLNLVQNALDATPSGGRVDIAVLGLGAAGAEVRVHDTGAGVSAELAQKLFSPGATTKDQGSGIGLVVARSIAEQHGGNLTLTNHESGGAVASLQLPLQHADSTGDSL